MRKEQDFLGTVEVEESALYGIHSVRARENFPDDTLFHREWYEAVGLVKSACYRTTKRFFKALAERFDKDKIPVNTFSEDILNAMDEAAAEVSAGQHCKHFIVPAVSGGAGTSINLNVDEIIANRALVKLGKSPGDYNFIDPIEHANIYQSTNDVIPTALKVASMKLLNELEEKINDLRSSTENLESEHRDTLRLAYTQMEEAVPSSYGKLFSAYSDALSRDWWRVSKCLERIKVINLGGSAVGTGMTVPRFFIMEVVPELQRLTGLPVTRGENLVDATQNLDAFAEVHGILKAHAVNLEKITSDLRLLASGVAGGSGISLPEKQVGSSIMPGKVNPVISEFVISAAHKVYANDGLINRLCGQGALDLNAYVPLIGHAMIDSLKLLIAANKTMKKNLLDGLKIDKEKSERRVLQSPSIATALVPFVGYKKAAELAGLIKNESLDIYEANRKLKALDEKKLTELMKPQNLLKLGYSVKDILD